MIILIYNIITSGERGTLYMVIITFVQSFSDPPHQKRTPLQYFREFVAEKILETVVNETNITSCKKVAKP